MSRTLYRGLFTGMVLIGMSMACGIPFTRVTPTETGTPTFVPTASFTETETPVPTASSVNSETPAPSVYFPLSTATPKFAPFCQPSSASVLEPTPFQCQVPIAEEISAFCAKKAPYNLISINAGSTYEMANDSFKCSEAETKDGKQILTCSGPMASTFELRVCDPACAIPTFRAGTTDCPQDLIFNDLLKCCEREPIPIDQNCVVLKLQTISCVVGCSEFTDQTTCEKNGYACKWDSEKNKCQLRK